VSIHTEPVDKLATSIAEALKLQGIGNVHSRPLTKSELCEYLSVSPRTVDTYVSTRRIPFIKIGRTIRFNLVDVQKALRRFTVKEIA
jgi:excisionase family DNA binding protein